MPGTAQSFSLGGSWAAERRIVTAVAHAAPERFGSETEAFTLSSLWLVNQDIEAHTQALLGIGAAKHRTPLTFAGDAGIRGVGQYAVQTTIQQSYFRQFQFIVGGSYFFYDRDMSDVLANGTTFNSGELAWMTTLRPITPFPRWSASLEFVKRPPTGEAVSMFLGYTRVRFESPDEHADSLLGGLDFELAKPLRADLTYNYFNPSNSSAEHYVALLIRYTR
jgi:hypothetical protein